MKYNSHNGYALVLRFTNTWCRYTNLHWIISYLGKNFLGNREFCSFYSKTHKHTMYLYLRYLNTFVRTGFHYCQFTHSSILFIFSTKGSDIFLTTYYPHCLLKDTNYWPYLYDNPIKLRTVFNFEPNVIIINQLLLLVIPD